MVLFLLALYIIVKLRATIYTYFIDLSYTAEQQCASKAEFDRVVTQMAAETAAVQSELNTWQNATIHILKRFLLDNPGKKSVINTGHWWQL